MPKSKTHSLRFTDDQWEALQLEAQRRGFSGLNSMMQAIADGDLPIGLETKNPSDLRHRVHLLEMQIEGLTDRLNGLSPTDLP